VWRRCVCAGICVCWEGGRQRRRARHAAGDCIVPTHHAIHVLLRHDALGQGLLRPQRLQHLRIQVLISRGIVPTSGIRVHGCGCGCVGRGARGCTSLLCLLLLALVVRLLLVFVARAGLGLQEKARSVHDNAQRVDKSSHGCCVRDTHRARHPAFSKRRRDAYTPYLLCTLLSCGARDVLHATAPHSVLGGEERSEEMQKGL
jgi:hypothetical protein